MAIGAVVGGVTGGIIAQRNGHNFWNGFAIGAVAGAAVGGGIGYLSGGAGASPGPIGDPWARVADPLAARGANGVNASKSASFEMGDFVNGDFDIYPNSKIEFTKKTSGGLKYFLSTADGEFGKIELGRFIINASGYITMPGNGPGSSYRVVGNTNNMSMRPATAAGFFGGSIAYNFETGNQIHVTQFATSDGMHSGHAPAGRDAIDIRYANNRGNVDEPVNVGDPNYDAQNSQRMIDIYSQFGFNGDRRYNFLTENALRTGPALSNTNYIDGRKYNKLGKVYRDRFRHTHHIHMEHYNIKHIRPKLDFPPLNPR